jgi:hypothetical protein
MKFLQDLMKKMVEESEPTSFTFGTSDDLLVDDDEIVLVVSYILTPAQQRMLHIIDEDD